MQNNVTIATSEKDLNVKYGMINFHPEREQARTSLKYILSDVNDIRKSYIRLGFHLHEFDRLKFYQDFGYATLAEFCETNLGLDKSVVSRCISVFLEFAKVNDCIAHTRTMFLDDKYEAFSYSQLCEMVSMTSEQRKLVKPEMTIKQIRELKKKENVSQDVSPVATSQPVHKFYDDEKASTLKGAALKQYIKCCSSLNHVQLKIYDYNGDSISLKGITDSSVSLLFDKNGKIVIRLNR